MKILNFFTKKAYLVSLSLIIINIIIILFYLDFNIVKSFDKYLIITFSIIVFHFFPCIFLESEFESNFLRILQLQLEKVISYISLIALVSGAINVNFGHSIYVEYLMYKVSCPFFLDNIDYKLHFNRKCSLYNINKENYHPFQYICSYNPEENQILSKFVSEIYNFKDYLNMNCSKVISLINNNKVVDDFVKEYYKEDNYYCDLKRQFASYYGSFDLKTCGQTTFNPGIFIALYLIVTAAFIILNYTYFRNIKANISIDPYIEL